MRLWLVLLMASLMVLITAGTLRLDTNADKAFGRDAGFASVLESPAGRMLTVLVTGPDSADRNRAAAAISVALASDSAIERVIVRPEAPAPALLDWIWAHRYLLAPPQRGAFEPDAMAGELTRARKALVRTSEAAFAPRYLQDPAGSFRRSIEGVGAMADTALVLEQGYWQSRDGTASVLFAEMSDQPFNMQIQQRLDGTVRDAAGAQPVVITGPRAVSASVNARISQRSLIVAGIATGLLLGWLAWLTWSLRGLALLMLPILVGAATAALSVQLAFGSLHAIAAGFGGALMGLAMDYPIHLVSHAGAAAQARALRCIGIGAATTSVAFLALLGSGLPVVMQVGVFVATGLLASALTCWALREVFAQHPLRPAPVAIPMPRVPRPGWIFGGLIAIASAILWQLPQMPSSSLVQLPPDVRADLDRVHQALDLPSGRYVIEVRASELPQILARQRTLAPVLADAKASGEIGRVRMLADAFPQQPTDAQLQLPALTDALEASDLTPSYAPTILALHEAALTQAATPKPLPEPAFSDSGLGSLLERTEGGYLGLAQLWDVHDPAALSSRLASADLPGVALIDRRADIEGWIADLTRRALWCLVVGGLLAVLLLAWLVPRKQDVTLILAATAAAASGTAVTGHWLAGGLGIFEIVSLILVVGIGIDYGLFLRSARGTEELLLALTSVFRCAVTTLLAFGVMAFSGVVVLESIGMTVSIGVALMMLCHVVRPVGR